jgi:ribosomal protein S18 acetylase RimI-like enzyme
VIEPRESPVTITTGGAELIPRLAPLWMALQEHHASIAPELARVRAFRTPEDSWSVRRRQYEQWLQPHDARVLIAEQGGEAVGYALVRIVPAGPTLETGDRVGELASLSVLPRSRGLGVGSRLMREVHRWLADLGVTTLTTSVLTTNSNALRFYKRLEMVELSVDLIGPVATTVPEG